MTQPGEVVAHPLRPGDPAETTPPPPPPLSNGNGALAPATASAGAGDGPAHDGAGTLREHGRPPFQPSSSTVDAGFFTWDIASGEVVCDPVTYRMHGLPEDPGATMDTFLSTVPESDLPPLRAAMEHMIAAVGTYQLEYRIAGPDGALRTMEVRGRVMPGPDGRPSRMMGMVVDITTMRAARDAEQRRLREVADRARRMHEFTASLASALTVNAIVDAAQAGIAAYGADSLLLVAERDGELQIAASCGLDDGCIEALSGLTSDKPAPISVAIQWSAPVYISSPEILAEDFPHLTDRLASATQLAWVALPVATRGARWAPACSGSVNGTSSGPRRRRSCSRRRRCSRCRWNGPGCTSSRACWPPNSSVACCPGAS